MNFFESFLLIFFYCINRKKTKTSEEDPTNPLFDLILTSCFKNYLLASFFKRVSFALSFLSACIGLLAFRIVFVVFQQNVKFVYLYICLNLIGRGFLFSLTLDNKIHHYCISILNRSYFLQLRTNLSETLHVGEVC